MKFIKIEWLVAGTLLVFASGLTHNIDEDDRQAWNEFATLVHPHSASRSNQSKPEWLSWANKCDAGLYAACKNIHANSHLKFSAERLAMEIPEQLLVGFNEAPDQTNFVNNFSNPPQLASVLFNPKASESIQEHHLGEKDTLKNEIKALDALHFSGADRHLPIETFKPGSEIVKLIWEIIPDTQRASLALYDPVRKPYDGPSHSKLADPYGWTTSYEINRNQDCSPELPQYGSSSRSHAVSINCFYWLPINDSNVCNNPAEASHDIQVAFCDPRGQKFLAFLVGFHVMKLTIEKPHWIWMTFYWTRETNKRETEGKQWSAPWNHFHEMTTTAIREDAAPAHKVCYNPYLEGWKDGVHSNCLSCHSFAAWSPDGSKVQSGTQFGDTCEYRKKDHGVEEQQRFQTCEYRKEQRRTDEQKYLINAVQTHFIWSVANSQDAEETSGRTLFRKKLKDSLQLQFQSQ